MQKKLGLFTLLVFMLPVLNACTTSSSSNPTAISSSANANDSSKNTPGNGSNTNGPTPPSPPPVPKPAKCLAAAFSATTVGAVCLTQGAFRYLDFAGSDLRHPENLKVTLFDGQGKQIDTFKSPKIIANADGSVHVQYGDDDSDYGVSFAQAKLSSDPVQFGYSVVDGESGNCVPVKSGTAQSCWDFVSKENSFGDNPFLPEVSPDTNVNFLYDQVKLVPNSKEQGKFAYKQFSYADAQAECKSLNARLPTPREVALEIEVLTYKEVIAETKFPNVALAMPTATAGMQPSDPVFLAEFTDAHQKGFNPVFKVLSSDGNGTFGVNFYFKSVDGVGDPLGDNIGSLQKLIVDDEHGIFTYDSSADAFCSDASTYAYGSLNVCSDESNGPHGVICVQDK